MHKFQLGLVTFFIAASTLSVFSSPPSWWATRSVLNSNPADDYAAANIGQLKFIATKAAEELSAQLPAGEETKFTQLINSWNAPAAAGTVRDDYAALTQGQLKAVAKLFYEHLASRGYYGAPLKPYARYPWTTTTVDDDDYSAVNVGQLKYVFSFSATNYIPTGFATDSDSDGIPDWWEIENGLNPFNSTDAATLNGGLTNLEIYEQSQGSGADPTTTNAANLVLYTP